MPTELERFCVEAFAGSKLSNMASIHPHINFNGNAEEAFNFHKAAFGIKWMIKFDPV